MYIEVNKLMNKLYCALLIAGPSAILIGSLIAKESNHNLGVAGGFFTFLVVFLLILITITTIELSKN